MKKPTGVGFRARRVRRGASTAEAVRREYNQLICEQGAEVFDLAAADAARSPADRGVRSTGERLDHFKAALRAAGTLTDDMRRRIDEARAYGVGLQVAFYGDSWGSFLVAVRDREPHQDGERDE